MKKYLNRENLKQTVNSVTEHETTRQFVKFVAFGIINTVFAYAVFAFFVLVGIEEQIALIMAFSIGVVWNYITSARFVFAQQGFDKLPPYAVAYIGNYLLNAYFLDLATDHNIDPLLAQAIIMPIVAISTFFIVARVLTGRWPLLS